MSDVNHNLSDTEKQHLERDGFLVRENVFNAAELRAIVQDCETLAERVTAAAHGKKHRIGSYMFERQNEIETYVKWEPDAPELLQLTATFGVVLIVRDVALAIWGAEDLLGPRAPGLAGTVELLGRAVELTVPTKVVVSGDRVTASGEFELTHAQLGMKPFTVMLGALQVADGMKFVYEITAQAASGKK